MDISSYCTVVMTNQSKWMSINLKLDITVQLGRLLVVVVFGTEGWLTNPNEVVVVVEAEAIVVVIADLVLVGADVVYSGSSCKSGSSSVTNQSEWDQMSFVGVRLWRRVLQPTQACHSIHTNTQRGTVQQILHQVKWKCVHTKVKVHLWPRYRFSVSRVYENHKWQSFEIKFSSPLKCS